MVAQIQSDKSLAWWISWRRRVQFRPLKEVCQICFGGEIATNIYNHHFNEHDDTACGETFIPQTSQLRSMKDINMGDKSPKANQKKSGQKQAKTKTAAAKKSAAVASKQAAGKKK